ncbi:MAG: right-handed parallel beta-helix repeat-containing protein [Actinomycetota bacterium]|nr:right-handed parallel beta-helix repeat-containing protein [Actinomycetota bacterium]
MVASYGSGTTFCLQAGTYSIADAVSPKSFVSIVGQPGTVISGARVVTGWSAAGQGWTAAGYLPAAYVDTGYNPCQDAIANLCKLDEWLFRDDVRLKRVSSAAAVVSGAFYTDYAANRIYVGDNPVGHLLEVSRTRTAITSTAANVTLKSLRVEKFATRNQQGAIVANASGWSIVDCDVRFNHGAGIYGYADGLHVIGSHVHHNGTLGIGIHDAKGILIEGNELDHNNTDGSWVNDGESGGYKSTRTTDTVRNNNVHENVGMGLWFDLGDLGSLIEGNAITGNAASGIRHEISHSAIIRNNILAHNGLNRQHGDHSLYYGGNIDIDNSDHVEVYGNIVSGGDNGIALSMQSRDGSVLSDVYVHDNDVTMAGGMTGMVQSVGDTSYFSSRGNRFARNRYALDSVVAPRFAWQNRSGGVSFWQGWQQDTTGTFVVGE